MQVDFVCLPVAQELYMRLAEKKPGGGVPSLVEDVLWDYLERTAEDLNPHSRVDGLTWGPLFLPRGTRMMMEYGGCQHFAEVTANAIQFEGETLQSPSKLASRIARNTSRDAWRDLWIRRPQDTTFIRASKLRKTD